MAGQPSDPGSTLVWRFYYQPLLDPLSCALLSKVTLFTSSRMFLCHSVCFVVDFCICKSGRCSRRVDNVFCSCYRFYNPQRWRVYSGDVSLSRMSFGSGKSVEKIINHEKYNTDTNDNDIALLKLSTPLTFSGECRILNNTE